jgi:hypothetical protein
MKLRMIKLIDFKEELDGKKPILSKEDREFIKSNQVWLKDHYMISLIPVEKNFTTDLRLGDAFNKTVNSENFNTEIMTTPYEMEQLTRMANLLNVSPIERNIFIITLRLFEDAVELNNHRGFCDYKNKTDMYVSFARFCDYKNKIDMYDSFAPIKKRMLNEAIVYNYIIGQYNDMYKDE